MTSTAVEAPGNAWRFHECVGMERLHVLRQPLPVLNNGIPHAKLLLNFARRQFPLNGKKSILRQRLPPGLVAPLG
jgi:hypothetical protein